MAASLNLQIGILPPKLFGADADTEIKHSDWFKIVMRLETANQSASFNSCIATLL